MNSSRNLITRVISQVAHYFLYCWLDLPCYFRKFHMGLSLQHLRKSGRLHRIRNSLRYLRRFWTVVSSPSLLLDGLLLRLRLWDISFFRVRIFECYSLGNLLQLLLSVVEATQHAVIILSKDNLYRLVLENEVETSDLFLVSCQSK